MGKNTSFSRREFMKKTATTGLAFSIVPSYVLGGSGRIAPSDKLNIALIGCGTQTNAMLGGWLALDALQFTSVCDPNRESFDYPLWGASRGETRGAAGGREVSRRRIEEYYAEKLGVGKYNGCASYADFRELLEKETDVDAVFVMTPDHLHAVIALAAMKKNICVATHKPISNFMHETRVAIEYARHSGVPTHCFFFQDPPGAYRVKEALKSGLIGKVKELHRWTNRPMWPQGSPYAPEPVSIPEGFDWQLWLGPSLDRPYSPDYTHTVFRGWYEFGGGVLGDMGHYGLWTDWRVLDLGMPAVVEASASFTCEIRDYRSTWVKPNHLSYPHAATIHWEAPVKDSAEMIDVYWYEGGIRPPTPKLLLEEGIGLPREGFMFIGDEGILWPRGYNDFSILGVKDAEDRIRAINTPGVETTNMDQRMIESFRGGTDSPGNFEAARIISEAICLGNLAIRMDQRLHWDNDQLYVTNVEEANHYIKRNFREGWEI